MKLVPSRPVRRLLTGLAPIVLVAAALPLLAPTCGGFEPGVKTFAKGSIIIPMDVCYQCTTDSDAASLPSSCGTSHSTPAPTATNGMGPVKACAQSTDAGDVVKSYGLVYQLIRNGISVYWVIKDGKQYLNDYDLTIQYNGGAPVLFYNWSAGGTLATPVPTSASTVNYMGGVFVVDGTDFAAASAILQDAAKIDKAVFSPVNLHVSTVAFQAYVKKTMAGGWDAGGTKIPKLGLLDIAASGTGTKNSYVVIAGYLQKAGLTSDINDPWPLGGTSAASNHGQIYDRLVMEDFLPRDASGTILPDAQLAAGDWKTTTFYKNSIWGRREVDPDAADGYSALWVPHWTAPGSCAQCTKNGLPISCSNCGTSCTCVTEYSDARIAASLRIIGAFQAAGGDLFAECAGLGSFDGVPGNSVYTAAGIPQDHTHFQTEPATPGFTITTATPGAPEFLTGNFGHPLMQIGDFQFVARSGAIATYKTVDDTSPWYRASVVRLISEAPATNRKDVFTLLPNVSGGSGSVVYMGGHSYSGTDGTYGTSGTRLVLNTLFNLGATCIANGAACSTGLLGICATGTLQCDVDENAYCKETFTPGAVAETCNGFDDDCDGQVDEDLSRACYTGPAGTADVGLCRAGTQVCGKLDDGSFGYGACLGQQLPVTELCDGADNDCNGVIDDAIPPRACYTGPSSTLDPVTGLPMGLCDFGTQSCSLGAWGSCTGQVLPVSRECTLDTNAGDSKDNNCNGLVDEGCGCTSNTTQACYTGPASTYVIVDGAITPKGNCEVGTQTCVDSSWGACAGQVLPAADEDCAVPLGDADCDGTAAKDDPACEACWEQACYEGPVATLHPVTGLPMGLCMTGTRELCSDGTIGPCGGTQILPSPEVCDGEDNDCDGVADDGPPGCGVDLACVNGICVREVCGGEAACPRGYVCSTTTWTCEAISDCCTGVLAVNGVCCAVPLDANGYCPGATAPLGTCEPGDRCDQGACDDPCDEVVCGPGTVCSGGECVGGACYVTGCPADQLCRNGACVPDPCADVVCPGGAFCRDNGVGAECVQSCALVSCLEGQICGDDGYCHGDPCHGVTCNPGDICIDGACVENACTSISCGTGKTCDRGLCKDDPCVGTTCPSGTCLPRDSIECTSAPCLRAQCFSTSNPTGGGTVPATEEGAGCGCGTGEAGSAALLLLAGLGLAPLARRRRRPGLPLLAVALALGGTLAGCPADEASVTCDGGACNTDALIAPFVSAISPATGLKGSPEPVDVQLTGARFQEGASVRIFPTGGAAVLSTTFVDAQHVVARLDLADAELEPYLLRVVNPDRVISNLATFSAVAKAPTVASVTPTSVVAPTVATLTVTGADFTPASVCMMKVGGFAVALPATLTDPTSDDQLSCTLDTSRVSAGATELWVVNEGGLASTARLAFTVVGQLSVTAVSPPTVVKGSTSVLTVYGAGFDATCRVTVDGVALTTHFVDPTRLTATWTAPASPPTLPTTVPVTVTRTGATTPAPVDLVIVESDTGSTTVDEISPQSAYQGASSVTLTFTTFTAGGDLANTTVQFMPPAGTFRDEGTVTGTGATVTKLMNFSNTTTWPAGEYQVRLKFTDGSTSATFPFTLQSNVPTLWAFATVPVGTPLRQGTTVNMSASGTTFFPGVQLWLLGSGGFTRAATNMGPASPVNTITGTFDLATMDTAVYQLVAKNTTSGYSNPLSFAVIPGQPSFAATTPIAPTCVVQAATPVTVTLKGVNFARPDALGTGGSVVLVRNPGLGIPDPTDPTRTFQIPSSSVTVVRYDEIRIAFDTTTAVPSDTWPYKLKVSNPGSTPLVTPTEVDLYVKSVSCP